MKCRGIYIIDNDGNGIYRLCIAVGTNEFLRYKRLPKMDKDREYNKRSITKKRIN